MYNEASNKRSFVDHYCICVEMDSKFKYNLTFSMRGVSMKEKLAKNNINIKVTALLHT